MYVKVKMITPRRANINKHAHAVRVQHVHPSRRHVNMWPRADSDSHGEGPAPFSEASVSSLTGLLNKVHR